MQKNYLWRPPFHTHKKFHQPVAAGFRKGCLIRGPRRYLHIGHPTLCIYGKIHNQPRDHNTIQPVTEI